MMCKHARSGLHQWGGGGIHQAIKDTLRAGNLHPPGGLHLIRHTSDCRYRYLPTSQQQRERDNNLAMNHDGFFTNYGCLSPDCDLGIHSSRK